MVTMNQFLLAFDHRARKLVVQREFGTNIEKAMAEYRQLEHEHRNNQLMDIVLIGSDSIESVRATHSTYFTQESRDLISEVLSRTD